MSLNENVHKNQLQNKITKTYDNMNTPAEKLFISISGLIGAGKTTLAAALGKIMNLPVYYEGVIDNVYLTDFYKDMSKYAFPLQIYLLNKRFKQHQQIIWQDQGGVQDRTIYEDSIFAKVLMKQGNMLERDHKTYMELFGVMSNFMRKPNLIVYLEVKPKISLERIKERARGCEVSVTLEYLKNLKVEYDQFIKEISKVIPVIVIDWNNYQNAVEVAKEIQTHWNKISTIRVIDKVGKIKN